MRLKDLKVYKMINIIKDFKLLQERLEIINVYETNSPSNIEIKKLAMFISAILLPNIPV